MAAKKHIILLPRENYWQWVRATQSYVLNFGVNITPDPVIASRSEDVTLADAPNGYPEQGNIVEWYKARFPTLRVDAIKVTTPEQLTAALQQRVDSGKRFGEVKVPPADGAGTTFRILWPTDYPVVTQAFGANPEIYSKFGLPGHEGVDIRAPLNTNVYAGADGQVFVVENNPNVHAYGKHIRIRHPGGFTTVYGHLASTLVSEGQMVKAKQKIGLANSTGNSSGSHLHLTLKMDGATAKGLTQFNGDIIDPTPFLVLPGQEENALKPTYPWPIGKCLVGLNVREEGTMAEADYQVVQKARLEAAKIQENTSAAEITRLRQINPTMFIVARLSYNLGQVKVDPQAWVARIRPDIERLYELGIRFYEVHQSPNLQFYGWNHSWFSGGGFARWWMDVVGQLRDRYPDAQFGFPGVSPGGQVEGQRLDAKTFIEQADEAILAADWVGVNCYWSAEADMSAEDKGAFYNYMRRLYPDKLLFITEFANVNELTNLSVKGSEYVKFYDKLRFTPGIAAAFSEVMSSRTSAGKLRWRDEEGRITPIVDKVAARNF